MMMVVSILFSLSLAMATVTLLTSNYYVLSSRAMVVLKEFKQLISLFHSVNGLAMTCLSLLVSLAVVNFLGNIPGIMVPSLFYYFSCTVSLSFWFSLMVVIFRTQFYAFMSHMLPYGSPTALMIFLPLVEVFSQLIRPFTLMVRLSTNLSSGHIMLYMFSFFSLSSLPMSLIIMLALITLFLLELFISVLQAYIFTSLMYLYLCEGVPSTQ